MGGEFFTRLRQFDVDHVAELILRVVGYSDDDGIAFDAHPFMVLAVVKIFWNVCHDAPKIFQVADLRFRSLFITYAFRTRPMPAVRTACGSGRLNLFVRPLGYFCSESTARYRRRF